MWTAEGPTGQATRLLNDRNHNLSDDQRIMFLCAWALWSGAGCVTLWTLIHRLKAHHLFTIGEVLQAIAGGSYATEAWLAKRACSFPSTPVARTPRSHRRERRTRRCATTSRLLKSKLVAG